MLPFLLLSMHMLSPPPHFQGQITVVVGSSYTFSILCYGGPYFNMQHVLGKIVPIFLKHVITEAVFMVATYSSSAQNRFFVTLKSMFFGPWKGMSRTQFLAKLIFSVYPTAVRWVAHIIFPHKFRPPCSLARLLAYYHICCVTKVYPRHSTVSTPQYIMYCALHNSLYHMYLALFISRYVVRMWTVLKNAI